MTRVVMEATSDYWKPPFYLLEAHGFEVWLVNAKDVKHLPGRPKTDGSTRCGCARSPSGRCCGPASCRPPPIRRLRDLTRYRVDLVADAHRGEEPGREAARGRPDQAVGRGQRHLRRLRAGDDGRADRRATRPGCWPQLARARMRGKIPQLEEAFTGLHRPPRVPAGQDARPHRPASTPTSPTSTTRSRPRSPLSLTRWPGWIEIPGIGVDRRPRDHRRDRAST